MKRRRKPTTAETRTSAQRSFSAGGGRYTSSNALSSKTSLPRLPVGRSVSSQSTGLSAWVDSSFATAQAKPIAKPQARVESLRHGCERRGTDFALWCDKYEPKSLEDLAVHRKKVQEVQQWLERVWSCLGNAQRIGRVCPIAVLTGPAGCGKTAVVKLLARLMSADVHEWQNSASIMNSSHWQPGEDTAFLYESQTKLFHDFLLRANKYGALELAGLSSALRRRLLLVEELPNLFYMQKSLLHDTLEKFSSHGRCPLLFIVSDSPTSEVSSVRLFPERVLCSLGVQSIRFNPVSQTSLVKTLTRIATSEQKHHPTKTSVPNKADIEALALSSCGDIRSAIHTLQFACRKDTTDLSGMLCQNTAMLTTSARSSKAAAALKSRPSRSRGQATPSSSTLSAVIGGRDATLFLFRALGKVLYCKRDLDQPTDRHLLPDHLAAKARHPVLVEPETVLEHSNLSDDMFVQYLHQNYLDFSADIDNAAFACENFSRADVISSHWAERNSLRPYVGSVGCRALMHVNSGATAGGGHGWRPLHKPQWFATLQEIRQRDLTARELFLPTDVERGLACNGHFLHTELIPFLARLNVALPSPDHISYVESMALFVNRGPAYSRLETLSEHDHDDITSEETAAQAAKLPTLENQRSTSLSQGIVPLSQVTDSGMLQLGDDLLTAEDMDAFVNFDSDEELLMVAESESASRAKKPREDIDSVQDFSDDDVW